MKQRILDHLKNCKANSFSEFMNYLYKVDWEAGLAIIDDCELREYVLLILL